MKVTFLGTGTSQGIPVIGCDHSVCHSSDSKDKRLRTSVLIEWENSRYVIDCGPDFRQQMLVNEVQQIDGIFFTHEHADHTAGLDDIRPFFFKQGKIPIYAHKRVLEQLKKRFDYIFTDKNRYPGAPAVSPFKIINNKDLMLNGVLINPINAYHGNLQVFGYRFNNFAYLTDIKIIAQEEINKLKNLDVLVVNALRHKAHHSHFNFEEALAFIDKVKPMRAYLTHISHLLGFHAKVEKSLPDNVFLAFDNLQISL